MLAGVNPATVCKVKLTCMLAGVNPATVCQRAAPAPTAVRQASAAVKNWSQTCSVTGVLLVPATSMHSTPWDAARVSGFFTFSVWSRVLRWLSGWQDRPSSRLTDWSHVLRWLSGWQDRSSSWLTCCPRVLRWLSGWQDRSSSWLTCCPRVLRWLSGWQDRSSSWLTDWSHVLRWLSGWQDRSSSWLVPCPEVTVRLTGQIQFLTDWSFRLVNHQTVHVCLLSNLSILSVCPSIILYVYGPDYDCVNTAWDDPVWLLTSSVCVRTWLQLC